MTTTTKPKKQEPRSPYRVESKIEAFYCSHAIINQRGERVAFAETKEQAEWLAKRLWLADRYLTEGNRRK